MEPVTVIASTIATWILNGFFAKGGEDLMTAIREKFKQQGTEGLVTRAENKPTESNVQILEAELVTQMDEDKDFEKKVRELVEQLKKEGVLPDSSGNTNTQNGGDNSTNIQFNDKVYNPKNFGNRKENPK
jgi:putative protein kinase ArgK-like GTPase of G3E family